MRGELDREETRQFRTIYSLSENTKVIKLKGSDQEKVPTESHTPNRIYVTIRKDGSDVKEIARYGKDRKKIYSIHTDEHKPYGAHVHYWKDGHRVGDAEPLSRGQKAFLTRVRNMNKGKK